MCGILAVLGCIDTSQAKRSRIIELSRRLRHRGPDCSGLHCHGNCYLAHQRLAIVDPASGDQPLYNEDKTVVVTVNGEIYNHKELREKLTTHHFRTGSDCEVITHLYEEYGEDFVDMLDGMFSFVLLDTRDDSFIAARDAIGITPLYMGWGLDGSIWFASEMKALSDDCERFISFPPGNLYSSKQGALRRWYNPLWYSEQIPSTPYDPLVLRKAFEKAVTKRFMTDVPFGVLLSGGLDSSLVAAVASRHMADSEAARQWGSQLRTFCIGLEGSPDLKAAREVADYLGTRHHEFYFTVQEGIDALEEVIYHTETYDVTTIRASIPMFLMSQKIKSSGVKMVISGDGSDEIFGGYLYFHKAPNKEEFHQETCRKIKALHLYDCLRANKSTSAWGVEARVPFLDKEFINIAMSIDPDSKMVKLDAGRMEKWILRNAFDDDKSPYLPKHILYRQKEQFSNGVGYRWIDGLKDHTDKQVTDAMITHANFVYSENTPTTKEAYYYRSIFEKFFPKNAARSTVPGGPSIDCSAAKAVEWDAAWDKNLDTSGRAALGVHAVAYKEQVHTKNDDVMETNSGHHDHEEEEEEYVLLDLDSVATEIETLPNAPYVHVEEEEEYVLLDLDSVATEIEIPPNAPYVLSGLDTLNPMLIIDGKLKLIGEYEETVGTCIVFSQSVAAPESYEETGPSETNEISGRCIITPDTEGVKQLRPMSCLQKILKFTLYHDDKDDNRGPTNM